MRRTIMTTVLMLCVQLSAAAQQTGRIKVERAVELPRHSYPVSTTVTAMFQDDQQFAALAQQLLDAQQTGLDVARVLRSLQQQNVRAAFNERLRLLV